LSSSAKEEGELHPNKCNGTMTFTPNSAEDITELAHSIPDRCNFRCVYCRSADPENYRDHDEILSGLNRRLPRFSPSGESAPIASPR